ncbi:MAG: hypothetical protein LBK28_00260, partial [Propionibacteriaceae bacterium]|nr:hypothetical protein [Propionibacteriaceae bacterium]
PALSPEWIDWLLTELNAASMLRQGIAAPSPSVEVVGTGELANSVLRAVLSADFSAAYRTDQPSGTCVALTILATDTFEPDRVAVTALNNAGMPHLAVRVDPGRARVGPLVIPGVTPCLYCHDLMLCAKDSAWPRLLAQLCQSSTRAQPHLMAWAAATAALQVRAFCDDTHPDALSRVIEINVDDHALHEQAISVHPYCTCAQQDSVA